MLALAKYLLVADRCLHSCSTLPVALDKTESIGSRWKASTNVPFVYAIVHIMLPDKTVNFNQLEPALYAVALIPFIMLTEIDTFVVTVH